VDSRRIRLNTGQDSRLPADLRELYRNCLLCPKSCGVDRTAGERGFCRETAEMRIAFAGIHRGEEPPISVVHEQFTGSGTIFFSGCTLACRFCQNSQISRGGLGRTVDEEEFAALCLRLQKAGAANINLVTGTHFIPSIVRGLEEARQAGLILPTVWNTSSFESPVGLQALMPAVDIFLADLKTLGYTGQRPGNRPYFAGFEGYPQAATAAVEAMAAARPSVFDEMGRMLSGCIVRCLVMPGAVQAAREVILWFAEHLKEKALLSLMVQYIDTEKDREQGESRNTSSRKRESTTYRRILELLDSCTIENGYIQEETAVGETEWLPDFNRTNPFPEEFADPVWHWRTGFL
jgi:putative pyruvate formate lyase activating enzyme